MKAESDALMSVRDRPEGGPDPRWVLWNLAKKFRIQLQIHLSSIFAIFLLGLILIREGPGLLILIRKPNDLSQWLALSVLILGSASILWYGWLIIMRPCIRTSVHWSFFAIAAFTLLVAVDHAHAVLTFLQNHGFDLLIVIATLATAGEAFWEIRGNKLSNSPRDLWFAFAMREAIGLLDHMLTYGWKMPPDSFDKLYDEFLDGVLKWSCTALCGRKTVHAAFLVKPPDRDDVLTIYRCSPNAQYPANLEIVLPGNGRSEGAAGVAFTLGYRGVVYVPDRETKKAWLYEWNPATKEYNMSSSPHTAWTDNPGEPKFISSLSVPVFIYDRNKHAKTAGVLAFSTPSRDPFVPSRDFLMAESFAHLISQVLFERLFIRQSQEPLGQAASRRRRR